MASRNSPSLNFSTLARDFVSLTRSFASAELTRFKQLECMVEEQTIEAELQFELLDRRPSVSTSAVVRVHAPCQWCLEVQPIDLKIETKTLLAKNEEQALKWADERQQGTAYAGLPVVIANELDFDAMTWFEDGLLLAWPTPVCVDEACERRPQKSYGEAVEAPMSRSREAFAELGVLKSKPTD